MNLNLEERLKLCDPKAAEFFRKIKPLLERGVPYGFLPVNSHGLAKRLSVSRSLCYVRLEELIVGDILRRCGQGYYCLPMVAERVARFRKR